LAFLLSSLPGSTRQSIPRRFSQLNGHGMDARIKSGHDECVLAGRGPRRHEARDAGRSGRVLFLVGSLSAPRLRHRFRPFPHLPPVPLGLRPADMDLESSNSGGGEEAARGGPLLRPRGLIATRSRKWLPPLAVVLERRGPTPHDRDGLGHASLMGQGWDELNAGAEGGDKWWGVR